jgi:hypothetical protein
VTFSLTGIKMPSCKFIQEPGPSFQKKEVKKKTGKKNQLTTMTRSLQQSRPVQVAALMKRPTPLIDAEAVAKPSISNTVITEALPAKSPDT